MKKESTHIMINSCKINFHFCHDKEPNFIPQNVERMLLEVGLPQYTPNEETAEKSA